VGHDRLYLVVKGRWVQVAYARIQKAVVVGYDGQEGPMAGWGLLGTLSTLSHGFVLILSAPIWLLTTAIAANAETNAAQIDGGPWTSMRKWARFPQGMPETMIDEARAARVWPK
jgi:hypothetical protein